MLIDIYARTTHGHTHTYTYTPIYMHVFPLILRSSRSIYPPYPPGGQVSVDPQEFIGANHGLYAERGFGARWSSVDGVKKRMLSVFYSLGEVAWSFGCDLTMMPGIAIYAPASPLFATYRIAPIGRSELSL